MTELGPQLAVRVTRTVEREPGVGIAVAEEDPRRVLSQSRAELEAMAGAAAEEPDVRRARMAAEEEVAVRAVLVLADAGLGHRLAREAGEAAGQDLPRPRQGLRGDEPLAGGGIEGRPPGVVRHLEATVFVAGDAVEDPLAGEIEPDRAALLVEPGIAGRKAEEEDLLPGRPQ